MKLGPVTKLDKRNKARSKKFDHNIMSRNCDALSFFQFLTNLERPERRIADACFVKLTWSWNISNKAPLLLLWVQVLFFTLKVLLFNADFLQKKVILAKLRGSLRGVSYFLKSCMCLYLRTKFQISSIILKSFRSGVILLLTAKRTPKNPPRLGLNFRYCACFKEAVPWHSGSYTVRIHSKARTWHDKNK